MGNGPAKEPLPVATSFSHSEFAFIRVIRGRDAQKTRAALTQARAEWSGVGRLLA
jgi:hypothetical protein